MKASLKTLFAATGISIATLATATVLAQPVAGRGPGASTAASQPQGRALERFQAADTNKDGVLSKEEAEKNMPRLATRFATLDSNQDGKLTPEEFQAMRNTLRGAGRQQGAGPQTMQSGPQQGTGKMGRHGGQMGGRMQGSGQRGIGPCMTPAADGTVSRTDIEKTGRPNALTRFDALDTNKDGKLSADERAACPAAKR